MQISAAGHRGCCRRHVPAVAARLPGCRPGCPPWLPPPRLFWPPSRPMSAMCWRSWLTASPPLRPASRASSELNSWALPDSCAARPPLAAISRCLSSSIEAKPRLLLPWFWFWLAMESLRVQPPDWRQRPSSRSDADGGGMAANVASSGSLRFLILPPRTMVHACARRTLLPQPNRVNAMRKGHATVRRSLHPISPRVRSAWLR